MIADILDNIKAGKNYYRDNLRKLSAILILCMFIIIALVLGIFYEYFTAPQSYYYATSSNGNLTQLLTVDRGTGLRDPQS